MQSVASRPAQSRSLGLRVLVLVALSAASYESRLPAEPDRRPVVCPALAVEDEAEPNGSGAERRDPPELVVLGTPEGPMEDGRFHDPFTVRIERVLYGSWPEKTVRVQSECWEQGGRQIFVLVPGIYSDDPPFDVKLRGTLDSREEKAELALCQARLDFQVLASPCIFLGRELSPCKDFRRTVEVIHPIAGASLSPGERIAVDVLFMSVVGKVPRLRDRPEIYFIQAISEPKPKEPRIYGLGCRLPADQEERVRALLASPPDLPMVQVKRFKKTYDAREVQLRGTVGEALDLLGSSIGAAVVLGTRFLVLHRTAARAPLLERIARELDRAVQVAHLEESKDLAAAVLRAKSTPHVRSTAAGMRGENRPRDVVYSHDGKHLAIAESWDRITVWNPVDGSREGGFDLPSTSYHIAFSPDDSLLYVAGGWDEPLLGRYDWRTGRQDQAYALSGDCPTSLAISSDGRRLFEFSYLDGTATLRDAAAGTVLRTIEFPEHMFDIALSPDGKSLAHRTADAELMVEPAERGAGRIIRPHQKMEAGPLIYTPDGRFLVVADGNGLGMAGEQVQLSVFDATQGYALVATAGVAGSRCTALGASHDGDKVVSGHQDGEAHAWLLPKLPVIGSGTRIHWQDNRTAIVACEQGLFHFDFHTGATIREVRFKNSALLNGIGELAENGEQLFTIESREKIGGSFEVATVDVNSGAVRNVGTLDAGVARDIGIVPGGKWLHAGDPGIRFYDRVTLAPVGKLLFARSFISGFSACQDGSRFAVLERADPRQEACRILVVDTLSGRPLYAFPTSWRRVTQVALSPDGKRLAVSNDDGTIDVWVLAE